MSNQYVYYKFECLPAEIKAAHKIKSKRRLDCTQYCDETSGYNGLHPLINPKGQMYLYLTEARDFVNSDSHRISEWSLTKGSLNFSSMYCQDFENPELSYGYPNRNSSLSNGLLNPFFPFRQDGYLFIMNKDITSLEIVVIPEGRNMIGSYYQILIDGDLDSELQRLRRNSKPFYDYQSIVSSYS